VLFRLLLDVWLAFSAFIGLSAFVPLQLVARTKRHLWRNYTKPSSLDPEEVIVDYLKTPYRSSCIVSDSSQKISQAIAEKRNAYLKVAQGTLLDLDHGAYPYVPSSIPAVSRRA
jgi:adenylosuccinate synthase